MPLTPILPILVPVVCALMYAAVPPRWRTSSACRYLPSVSIAVTIITLLVLKFGPIATGVYRFDSPLPVSIMSLGLVWDGLALQCALLPMLGVALQSALETDRDDARPIWAARLIACGAAAAGCAAADLITLCISWALLDMALMAADLIAVRDATVDMWMERVWARLLSLFAIIVAAMLLLFDQGRTAWAYVGLDPTAQLLVAAAVWLRLGVFPLNGGQDVGTANRLIGLSAGGYVWLRLTSVAIVDASWSWLVIALVLGALALSIVALLAQTEQRRLEAVHLQGLALMMLAPLVDPMTGPAVATMILVGLGQAMTAQAARYHKGTMSIGVWEIVPWIVVLASLGGLPLTLLGDARWGLIKLAALAGLRGAVVVIGGSCAIVSIACWRAVRQVWQSHRSAPAAKAEGDKPDWRGWLAWGSTLLSATLLVITGLVPPIIERIWRGGFVGIDIPLLRTMLQGPSQLLLVQIASTVLLPATAIWAVERAPHGSQGLWYRGPLRDVIERIIALDWLYVGLGQGLGVVQSGLRRLVRVIEESFVMGWTVFWILVFVLYVIDLWV